ncbi:MAG: YbaK/EbsC family protein [Pseudomonadota bacterium]
MTIAQTVSGYLQSRHVSYDVIAHPYSDSSRKAAETAHVPPEQLAKAVILSDRRGFLMAVVPGDRHVSLEDLWKKLGRRLSLTPENRLAPVFRDCESGAIPPLGPAYGMETIVDDSLVGQSEVYFESGDHRGLIRVGGDEFLALLQDAMYGQFAH